MRKDEITNRYVLNFFADKEVKKDGLTYKYGGSPTGPYAELADAFLFYRWLEKQDFSKMNTLSEATTKDQSFKEFILKPDLDSSYMEKWHLYVSWYALKEYWQTKDNQAGCNSDEDTRSATGISGILKGQIRCFRLLLWMYEASKPDVKSEKYKEIEKQLIEMQNEPDKQEKKKKKNDLIKELRAEIINNICR